MKFLNISKILMVWALVIIFILGLIGCLASTKITSKSRSDFVIEIKRVFVISSVAKLLGDTFANDFEQRLLSYFQSSNIEAKVLTIRELDLEQNEKLFKTQISTLKPNAVMTIKEIGGTKYPDSRIVDITYDVRLMPTQGNVILWRAKVEFWRAEAKSDSDVLARDIIKKLKEDGIIK